jgi:hypothetical protein
MKRLYPRYRLDDAIETPLTRSEARRASLRDFRRPAGLIQLTINLLLISMMAVFIVANADTWLVISAILMFGMMIWNQYDTYMSHHLNPTLYSDLDDHRKELEEFLKEKGYFDPK